MFVYGMDTHMVLQFWAFHPRSKILQVRNWQATVTAATLCALYSYCVFVLTVNQLQIVATSGNESDVADITVMITDENDNTPAFTQTEYVGNFTEYAKEGHFILQVQVI